MRYLYLSLCCCLLFCMLSCSTPSKNNMLPKPTQRIVTQSAQAGFSLARYQTSTFMLTTYEHLLPEPASTVHVYIEGDGHSWKTRYVISHNPTPHQPLALTLAMQDSHPHVIYLARACQYTPLDLDQQCHPKYWSSHRYAPEVIQAAHEALDQIKLKTKSTNFVLIGFSGGASIAALVASQRTDVVGLITVAGDLDNDALNRFHHTTPLTGSLNPIKVAHLLKDLPQQHWSGSKDRIVPPWVASQFAQKVNHPACVKTHTLKGVEHHKGWEKQWPELLKQPLTCDHIKHEKSEAL